MTAPFHYQTDPHLKFIDIAILKFYDRVRNVGIDVVARRMLRQTAVADETVDPSELRRLARKMPLLTVDRAYLEDAQEEVDKIPEQRVTGIVSSSDSAKKLPRRDPKSRTYSFRLSPYEVLLLEYLQSHFECNSRQRALELAIRNFLLKDRSLEKAAFRRFANKLMDHGPRSSRRDSELQVDAFLSMVKAS